MSRSKLKMFLIGEKEAWLRFLVALCGLTLAFTAAVFATVERIAGNGIASVVLASMSLVIAAVVAFTAVPYLARRVTFKRVRDVFDYDVTREGVVYLAFTLIIGIAALNTGNNLLFLIVSVMLAAIIVSGMVSVAVLRALSLEVVLPAHVFAATSVIARLKLRNQRRWVPSFSVSVTPVKERKSRMHGWRDGVTTTPPVLGRPVYFPYVPAKTTATTDIQLRFERRGRYAQDHFGLTTRFPFSFFRKTRRLELAQELIVYPEIGPTDEMLQSLPMILGEFESFVRGRGFDLYLIRDHVPEDSARLVDWKATAKTSELKVREFTREDERKLRIVFDNPCSGMLDQAAYERAVSLTASLAWHLSGEGIELSFSAPGFEGSSDLHEFLRYMATVEPLASISPLDGENRNEHFNLIVTARARGTVPTSLWARSYLVFVNGDGR